MILGLVRQRPKNVCSASNDWGENPQNPAKKRKKNATTRKSWNLVVLGSFRFFLLFQKSSRFVYPAVVLRFPRNIHVWNKVNHFLVCLTYLLRTTIFPRQWRVEAFYAQVSTAEAGADKNGPLRKTASRQEVSKMIQNDNRGTSHRYAVDMQ